jgi:beta-mannosidase
MPRGLALRVHHPEWKARTPRDLGAGWDFEDVRDHYLHLLFGVTPAQLRYADHDRYVALSRIVTGELLATTFGEWRRKDSSCNGAIIWLLRDLWPGAGWGVIDALGKPKAPYYYLRRALQPIAIAISDEGGNGLFIHLCNEQNTTFNGTLALSIYKSGDNPIAKTERAIVMAPHSRSSLSTATLLDAFYDLSNAYRFGPPVCDYVVVTLVSHDQTIRAERIHVRAHAELIQKKDLGLTATAVATGHGSYSLTLSARELSLAITFESDGYQCEDQYFDLAPNCERTVVVKSLGTVVKDLRATVTAVNSLRTISVDVRT